MATSMRMGRVSCTVLLLVLVAGAACARDKSDVITLRNGDRLTGEILNLEYGRLLLKTDALGTVSIEWPSVQTVSSDHRFLIERLDGEKYHGPLYAGDQGLAVEHEGATLLLPLEQVVQLGPAEERFWDRLSGNASIGLNYSKASSIKVGSFRLDSQYRGTDSVMGLSLASDVTSSPSSGTTQRLRLDYNDRFLLRGANFTEALGSFERIGELGIDGRLQAGFAVGHTLYQHIDANLSLYGGLAVNEEWAHGQSGGLFTLEGVAGADWRVFRFNSPEVTLHTSLVIYPSLTDIGRVRARLDNSLARKFYRDFTLTLSLYDDYDSRPPGTGVRSNDFGIVTALGYAF